MMNITTGTQMLNIPFSSSVFWLCAPTLPMLVEHQTAGNARRTECAAEALVTRRAIRYL